MADEEWREVLAGDPLDVDWGAEGDEWVEHVFAALSARVPHSQWSITPEGDGRVTLSVEPTDGSSLGRIELTPGHEGIFVHVLGASDDRRTSVDAWAAAIAEATSRVGVSHHAYNWIAAIGPTPGRYHSPHELSSGTRVGPLTLEPFRQALVEYWDSGVLANRAIFYSFPIRVRGTTKGYKWNAAAYAANRELRKLCCFISLAWGVPWTLRERPHDVNASDAIEIPPPVDWDPGRGEPSELPPWINDVWPLLVPEEPLSIALDACYEGKLLYWDHPSFALVAFVAAIELLGTDEVALQRCETCGTMLGSRGRFFAAVRRVRSEAEAKALRRDAYDASRSKTAHEGRLHGHEHVFGSTPFPNIFTADPHPFFAIGLVRRVEEVAPELLTQELQRRAASGALHTGRATGG